MIEPIGWDQQEHSISASQRLWSRWDMLKVDAARFMAIITHMRSFQFAMQGANGVFTAQDRARIPEYSDGLKKACVELNLPVSADLCEYLATSKTMESFRSSLAAVEKSIHAELKRRKFFEPDQKFKDYFESAELFGRSVFEAFPSANEDIFEAGTCLALERGTACVMHLMRVMEVGLAALARAVGVQKQNDWGSYLREIDKELARKAKAAGARSSDEQFYAESAASFDHVRRAWRNPTMHVEHTYSLERAREILEAVKSFMSLLATKVSEAP